MEYISKEKVLDIFAKHYPYAGIKEGSALYYVKEDIKKAEPANVAPVVHGKWNMYPIADGMNQCSKCGLLRFGESNYCPNCGAKMTDGGDPNAVD